MVIFHEAVETMVVLLGIFLIRRTKLEGSQAVCYEHNTQPESGQWILIVALQSVNEVLI